MTVDVWSTQQYAVTAAVGAPYNVVPRVLQTDSSPACRPSAGSDGFSIDLSRTFTSLVDPAQTRSDVVTTTYQPSNAVVCGLVPPPT